MNKRQKFWTVFSFLLLSTLTLLTVFFGVRRFQSLIGRAGIEKTSGHPNLVSANLYGVPAEEVSELQAAATALTVSPEVASTIGWENENSEVQNVQPPSISGFSTDLFTGNATVTYPLDIPPGRGGLTPSISLNYSSASVYDSVIGADFDKDGDHDTEDVEEWKKKLYQQSSQVGLGWNIGGLGYIFRDSRNRYTLVLNGQSYRLFREGEWWRTEPEGFLKIRHRVVASEEPGGEYPPGSSCTENDDPSDSCVKKFEVVDTAGTRYQFTPRGFFWKRCDYRSEGGRCVQATEQWCRDNYEKSNPDDWWLRCEQWAASYNKWVLNRVTDVLGNEIDIPYAEERQELKCGKYRDGGGPTYPRALYPYEVNYSGAFDPAGIDAGFKSKIEFYPLHPEIKVSSDQRRDDEHIEHRSPSCRQVFYSERRIERINIKVRRPDNSWQTVRQYELQNDAYFTASDDNDELHPKLTAIVARGRDDDGDGLGDQAPPAHTFVYADDPGNLDTYRLLTAADNGYGGRVEYRWERYPTTDYNPQSGERLGVVSETHRVVAKKAFDGFGNFYQTSYSYDNPRGIADNDDHSGFESLGHEQVTETVFTKNSDSAVVKTTTYQFAQGEADGNRFYPIAERGRVRRAEVKDANGTLLSFSENDYRREPSDRGWKTSHFVAVKESRSCQDPTSAWPKGGKTTYHYEPRWQDGRQYGNLTNTTEYLVPDCNFDAATAYRMTLQSFNPNTDKNIVRLPSTSTTFACNSNLSGTVSALADCPKPKRLANSWNVYDGDYNKLPWSPPDKGLLTLRRTLYEFPERVDPENFSEWRDGRFRVVDVKNEYDRFGNLTASETFNDYGIGSTSGLTWSFSPPGNGSQARRSEVHFESTYNTFPVETVNPLGQRTATSYQYQEASVDHPYLADRILTQDQNDINNQLHKTAVLDSLGRPVEKYLSGDSQPVEKIAYSDQAPYTVHRQSRDSSYQHSWQIYNGLGQLVQTQTEEQNDGQRVALVAKSYNALGQVEKETLPNDPGASGGGLINPDWNRPKNEFTYDSLGRTLTVTAPPGQSGPRITQTAYFGRKTAVLDPNHHLKVSEVDGLGRLLSSQTFLGERNLEVPTDPYTTMRFEYDALDRLTVTTDALGNTSKVFYNQYGQKERTEDPDLGVWRYTYYPTGSLATSTDAKGQLKSFVYDGLDRTVHKYYGDANTPPVASFTYDSCPNGIGRRCGDSTINNPAQGFIGATTAYAYDVKGRLQSQTKTIEGQTFTTQFAYDDASRIREITYPDGEKVTYAYNDAGRLVNVSGNQAYLASAQYNISGLPTEEVLGNQTKNIYAYEPGTFRLGSISVRDQGGANLWSQSLGYDPAGNIKRISYSGTQAVERALTFGYDALDRLTTMQTEGRSSEPLAGEYRYDELGRMALKKEEVLGAQTGCQPPTIPGDANCNCRVDIFDLVLVGVNYGEAPPDDLRADLNGDGRVDIFDLVLVGRNYGNACE